MNGGLVVCGTGSDAGKSFLVTGLCRLLARRGVRVAPFKAQNMANNASVTAGGAEIASAQWTQAVAAGAEPEADMNPVLLKPTSERASQVVVQGRAVGTWSAQDYQARKGTLLPVVLEALESLRRRYDVVVCEGAGSPAEINLLDGDIVNLRLARAARLPAIVVGDIDRGGVFASLYGTVSLLPADLRGCVQGFVLNKFRGDPALLGSATGDLERRCRVPTLGVLPMLAGTAIDDEDSLGLDRWTPGPGTFDVAAVRFSHVANFGDLDPLRAEPGVSVRWVRGAADLGRPALLVLPGSKSTRADLAWLRASGLADAIAACGAPTVGICAGAQALGHAVDDHDGIEGAPGSARGLGLLPLDTRFEAGKVLDRPRATAVAGPAAGHGTAGYRIHCGRVSPRAGARPWLVAADGTPVGWHEGRVAATTLHGLFEADGFRTAVLRWAAAESGTPEPDGLGRTDFAAARVARFDRIADTLEAHLDLDRLFGLIEQGARVA